MKVARWGNSLAVRLPREVAEALSLKEGDEVTLTPSGGGVVQVSRDRRREEALSRLRAYEWPVAPDFTFDRDEIYDRIRSDGGEGADG